MLQELEEERTNVADAVNTALELQGSQMHHVFAERPREQYQALQLALKTLKDERDAAQQSLETAQRELHDTTQSFDTNTETIIENNTSLRIERDFLQKELKDMQANLASSKSDWDGKVCKVLFCSSTRNEILRVTS
jgi:DNA repair exonuclease SbcCD ATPase subunit